MTLEDSVPVMMWRSRPDMGCEHVNRAWSHFTGFSAEEAQGEGWLRCVHAEDLARWLDTCVRAYDAHEPFEIEYRLRQRDGEYRWVLDRAAPRYAPNGLFLGYGGACIDIDARRRRETDLARALERERRLRLAGEEASRAKEGFLASVLNDLRSPVQAMATWAAHLRSPAARASDAAEALEAIEHNARQQNRMISSLLDLQRGASGELPPPRSLDEPLLNGVRVLLVEDDAAVREHLRRVLSIAGAQVRSARNSAEALQTMDAWRPDIMLSDMNMRGDDGYVLIRAVRSLPAEQGGCVRTAALTAEGAGQAASRAVAAGYDAQLAKPVEPVALLALVARLVQPAGV